MIREVKGDILLSECQVIAHGLSPNDDFHSGLAHQLREQWPSMAKDFKHYCRIKHPQPGDIWVWSGVGAKRIVCLMTQEAAYGHGTSPGKAHVEYVNHALRALAHWLEQEKIESIALPKLATGVGGLDWDVVQPLIKQHLGNLNTRIDLYSTYAKGVAA